MMGAHAVAAVMLAVFLRLGEARLHAAARRRLLRWVVALRLALAGRPGVLPRTRPVWFTVVLQSMWVPCVPEGRGPPAFSCLQP
jgi:hypothetical protein